MAAEAVALLRERRLHVATAEATTGGLVGHLITGVPGSSAVFTAGVAPYSNHAKRLIGVPAETLEQYGAVSAEAATALAIAVRELAGVDIGLAETGIAGPGGGTDTRPAGQFFIALASSRGASCEPHRFHYDRNGNRRACARAALRLLISHLQEVSPPSTMA